MEAISLFSPEAQADPYPIYRLLREQAPVYREPQHGAWVLTRYEDVYGALRDHQTFSSAKGIAPGLQGGETPTVITTDPPRHTRLRALVSTAFTSRTIARIEPWIRQVVDDLLDRVGDDPVDVVDALTYPLPVIVIAHLLGIPPEDRDRFKRWSDAAVGITELGIREENQAGIFEMLGYFRQVAEERRAQPLDDLVSAVVHAEVDGERLEEREVLAFCVLLLVAGNETTTNLISNLLNVMADRPDLWDTLRRNRELTSAAVEEALRYESPVQALWRTTTRDVAVRGTTIPEDAKVMVVYASANRDPDEFPDPDSFRLDRGLNRHLAFGHGIHRCLGAPLARLEANIALNGMLERFSAVERTEEPGRRLPSSMLRGFARLPLAFRR